MFSNIIRNQQHIVVTSDEWMGARLKRSEDFYDNSFHGGAYTCIFSPFISQAGRLADLDRLISEQIHFIEKVRNMVNVFCIILFEKNFLN